jgi:hypothetical protein
LAAQSRGDLPPFKFAVKKILNSYGFRSRYQVILKSAPEELKEVVIAQDNSGDHYVAWKKNEKRPYLGTLFDQIRAVAQRVLPPKSEVTLDTRTCMEEIYAHMDRVSAGFLKAKELGWAHTVENALVAFDLQEESPLQESGGGDSG